MVSHLIGVFCREILHWGNDALSNQLTIGGRSLLLDQLCFLAADWRKQAAGAQIYSYAFMHTYRLTLLTTASIFSDAIYIYIYMRAGSNDCVSRGSVMCLFCVLMAETAQANNNNKVLIH